MPGLCVVEEKKQNCTRCLKCLLFSCLEIEFFTNYPLFNSSLTNAFSLTIRERMYATRATFLRYDAEDNAIDRYNANTED